jgi:cell wall-associated NlpC family hydrolase
LHCEKCGSADTEVTKCGKCGQKSLIRCHNCGNQVCADKYCEVISIKRKIKILTYFAMGLVLLIFLILPVVIMKAMEEPEEPTKRPRPTQVASKPPTTPPKPTPAASKPPPKSPAQLLEERRQKVAALGRQLAAEKVPYKKGSSDPRSGGLDFLGYVQHTLKAGGINVSRSPKEFLKLGPKVSDKSKLVAGDVLFFTTKPDSRRPNFVGIYLGKGDFGCAFPSGKRQGVLSIALDHPYWAKRYLFGVHSIR